VSGGTHSGLTITCEQRWGLALPTMAFVTRENTKDIKINDTFSQEGVMRILFYDAGA